MADFIVDLGENLIIEFVPKSDSRVKRLLASRLDIFPEYYELGFEEAFNYSFEIVEKVSVTGSERSLYLLKHR